MADLKESLRGRFLVLDGPDGAGKTTQLGLLRDHLADLGIPVEVVIDPGTTKIGQKIRSLLLDRDNGEIAPMCETLLFMASRAQLMDELVLPALRQGKTVLCDRFVSATVAYQGASGVAAEQILQLAEIAIQGRWPDLTLVLDLPVEAGFERLGVDRTRLKRPSDEELQKLGARPKPKQKSPNAPPGQMSLFGDRMESRSSSFHECVRRNFRDLPNCYPAKVCSVDAVGTQAEVFQRVIAAIEEALAV